MAASQKKDREQGFTIVELMIATTILSMLLLLATSVMISISNLYYKGITVSRTQDNARSIADEISQRLKYASSPLILATNGSLTAYCVGNTRYTFQAQKELGGSPFQHVLWRDTITSGGCSIPSPTFLTTSMPSAGGAELIAPNSMLTGLSISSSSPYTIDIGVAYGDGTLLTGSGINATCSGNTGDQFCAVSRQTTAVISRL